MKGFNSIIKEAMQTYFQDTDGFLHFPDGNQNRLSTMSIVGRKYFERSGYIYHKSYLTEYCDNEEQEKAIRLNKYKYMGDDVKIMSHINPYHGHGGTMDDLYTRNAAYSQIDRDNYFKRLSENFYL